HLNRLYEFAVAGVDDDAVLFAVSYIDIAVVGIDGDSVDHAEMSLASVIAEPLADKLAVLIKVQNPRGAAAVGAGFTGVIGAFVRVTHANIDVAVRSECQVQGLP